MEIANDERLSMLKRYAKRRFGLTRNVKVLVMLVSEEDLKLLKKAYRETERYLGERAKIVDQNTVSVHGSKEFFPREAMMFSFTKKERKPKVIPLLLTAIETVWKFRKPRLDKFEYFIMMRKEKLADYAKKRFDVKGSAPNFSELGFSRLLIHEFLHIVERELHIHIFTGDIEKDFEITTYFMKQMPQSFFKKIITE